ncbi:MAG: hypothetical protein O7E57_00180 [Gammaproteobacteria bacterium]|nr:hypothetical protein [Gammaproteobacteria bacterium]
MFLVLVFWGFTPIAALAAACENYPLSDAQLQHIDEGSLEIDIPEGEVPVIERCDTNGDNMVDINDIRDIARHRNQPAAHPDDPMDWDRNNVINILDARGCQLACSYPRCRVQTNSPETQAGGASEAADCYQADDFDGDGKEDFAGMFEHTGEKQRGGEWTLEVVIFNEDENGEVQSITYPYSGQNSKETGEIKQHLSKQPAGMVNLNPGTLMIEKPAIVSYQDGEPKVLYYFEDGKPARAFYGVDD